MKFLSTIRKEDGFGAASLFFIALIMIFAMSATGMFVPPKSPTVDTNFYQLDTSPTSQKNALNLLSLKELTPTPTIPVVIPTTTPIPTVPPPVYIPGGCTPYTIINGCECRFPHARWVYCNGKIPPDTPSCMIDPSSDDTRFCDGLVRDNPSCAYWCMGKPVIYLYPEKPTFVTVTLGKPETLIESIPEYGTGWLDVLAFPGGVLKYKGNYYRELYYESSQEKVNVPDNGIFIPTQNLKPELKSQTEKLGLLAIESQEFVDYWLPRLQQLNKPYIFFSVLTKQEKERTDHVEISPKPDVFIEFIAYFKGVDEKFETKPFIYPVVPKRQGFTAVEWGGTIDPQE